MKKNYNFSLYRLSILLLISYYISSIFLLLIKVENFYFLKPLLFTNTNSTARYINSLSSPIEQKEVSRILFFYKNDPEILFAIANNQESMASSTDINYYKAAIKSDPQNKIYYWKYFTMLKKYFSIQLLKKEIYSVAKDVYQERLTKNISEEEFIKISDESFSRLLNDYNNLRYDQLFYALGETTKNETPKITEKLWQVSLNIYPDLGHYHVEVASMVYFLTKNKSLSKKILIDCQIYKSPAKECKDQLLYPLPEPGSFLYPIINW